MKYINATKLHIGDEVVYRDKSPVVLHVIEIENDEENKDVFIRCEDGNLYHHTALK